MKLNTKYILVGLAILLGVSVLFYSAKKKAKPQAIETPASVPVANQNLKIQTIPDINDVKEQNQFLKSISKAGRGLVNINGHANLSDCEKVLWKNFKVQGLCQKAGSCACRDPKVCQFGACFIAMDPLPDNKKPVYFIRHLYRSLIGLEPGLKLISEMRSLSCLEAIKKIGNDRFVLDSLEKRNFTEKLNYYSKALWGKELTEKEQLSFFQKMTPLKFDLNSYIKIFTEAPETKSACSRWNW